MAYPKTTWTNGTSPAINATNLNKIEQGIYDASVLLDKNVSSQTTITSGASEYTIPLPSKKRIEVLAFINAGSTCSVLVYLDGTNFAFTVPVTQGYFQLTFEKINNNAYKVTGIGDDFKGNIFAISNISNVKLSFPPGSGQTFTSGSYYYLLNSLD